MESQHQKTITKLDKEIQDFDSYIKAINLRGVKGKEKEERKLYKMLLKQARKIVVLRRRELKKENRKVVKKLET
jgi:hypothetical protein